MRLIYFFVLASFSCAAICNSSTGTVDGKVHEVKVRKNGDI